MSFDVNWENLVGDGSINDTFRKFLDHQFRTLTLPPYIDDIRVTKFSLGSIPPEITIRHIGDPFKEFYEDGEDEGEQGRAATRTFLSGSSTSDEEDEQEEKGENLRTAISSNDLTTKEIPITNISGNINSTPLSSSPSLKRKTSDPLHLMTGNGGGSLNYLNNYGMNNIVGLGHLNASISHNRPRTPTDNPNEFMKELNNGSTKVNPGEQSKLPPISENDIQCIVDVDYLGDLCMEVTVNLLVNFPSPQFISLPIKLHVSDLAIHSVAAIAYLKNCIFFSLLCDIDDNVADYFSSFHAESNNNGSTLNTGGNFVDYITAPNTRERIDIIKKVKIESEIGEVENNILRNVGKVERFLIEKLRTLLREEIAWPSWVCFDMNDSDVDDDNDSDDDDDDIDDEKPNLNNNSYNNKNNK
ncbi:uncharacterized protein PRCAT00001786001 [Priceomyces carsonii]|uniref:uncharacterized protein n=1 Tax=Priceomyces carsonii TaxID=28549 RepID=UPI002ED8EDE6|nr:unnamed protein product [Priceomyces carsonii]